MRNDDWQVLADVRYFTREMLSYADVLPPDLAAMLSSYATDLDSTPPGIWEGTGSSAECDHLAELIGQSITDGEWPHGESAGYSPDDWWCRVHSRGTVMKALRLLAVKGELTPESGGYQVRQ